MRRMGCVLAILAVIGASCSGGESQGDASTTSATAAVQTTTTAAATTTTSTTTSTTTASPSTTTSTTTVPAGGELPEGVSRLDLLTFAQGALFVQQSGLASGSAGRLLRMIDGDPQDLGYTTDAAGPVEVVYKLPSPTTFDRFAIPNVTEAPGNATFFASVVVSGSSDGPDAGYQVLAAFELAPHGPDQEFTEIRPDVRTPVRWVKVRLEGGMNIEEGDEGNTGLHFTEIIGNGTQEVPELSTAFSGVWDFRLTERLDIKGTPLELMQTGATITGCLDTILINGSVNGRIARATGFDPARDDRPSSFIFVADEDGTIEAAWSEGGGVFKARTAVIDPTLTSSPCSEAPPEPRFCGVAIYVNFDVDSAVIRPESARVLADLYDGLVADEIATVSVVGHTSTEGSVEYNQDLSERRAQAVVNDLVARGFDPGGISAVGKGETEPLLSPDDDESSRSVNRRVEIDC